MIHLSPCAPSRRASWSSARWRFSCCASATARRADTRGPSTEEDPETLPQACAFVAKLLACGFDAGFHRVLDHEIPDEKQHRDRNRVKEQNPDYPGHSSPRIHTMRQSRSHRRCVTGRVARTRDAARHGLSRILPNLANPTLQRDRARAGIQTARYMRQAGRCIVFKPVEDREVEDTAKATKKANRRVRAAKAPEPQPCEARPRSPAIEKKKESRQAGTL